jgi:hypothetical protein
MAVEEKLSIDLREEFRGGFREYNYGYGNDVISNIVRNATNTSRKTFESL